MRAVSLVAAVVLATGCFYTDPLNQRPAVQIEQTSDTAVARGGAVTLRAVADDPNGDAIALAWAAYACATATACDDAPMATASTPEFQFAAPLVLTGGATPAASVLVTLNATDSYGAVARPAPSLVIPLADAPPTVALALTPRPSYVANIPVTVYAKIGDPDDGPNHVAVQLAAFGPDGDAALGSGATTMVDPAHVQLAAVFTPDAVGQWTVQATASDPEGAMTAQSLVFQATTDQPPCLAQWAPAVPPDGESLPIDVATLFQVLVVTDDLDPFPATPDDPVTGVTAFSWSLLPPGATTRVPLVSDTGASVALDPASYAPGDVAELRVEIYDRTHTAIPCADSAATCSIGANPQCNQRMTWRVEMQ